MVDSSDNAFANFFVYKKSFAAFAPFARQFFSRRAAKRK
jgi:hypothetical protein